MKRMIHVSLPSVKTARNQGKKNSTKPCLATFFFILQIQLTSRPLQPNAISSFVFCFFFFSFSLLIFFSSFLIRCCSYKHMMILTRYEAGGQQAAGMGRGKGVRAFEPLDGGA